MATIFIVEDEEAVAWVMAHVLRKAGHTPILAATGEAALRDPRAPRPDRARPRVAGPRRRLKATPETARIPMVIASGELGAAAVVAESGARAMAAILRKPLQLPELCAAVAAVLRAPAEGEEWAGQRRGQVLYRFVTEGSNALVRQVCHRLEADRPGGPQSKVRSPHHPTHHQSTGPDSYPSPIHQADGKCRFSPRAWWICRLPSSENNHSE